GHNRVEWDLRHEGATVFAGIILRSANPGNGPWAVPGPYQVRVTADGQSQTRTLELKINPNRKDVTVADLQAQFALASEIRDKTSAANDAVVKIRAIREQVNERVDKDKDPALARAASALLARLSAVEEQVYQVKNRSPKDPL